MRSGIRIRVAREPLRSVVAWAAMLGCAVLLAVALAGCGPLGDGITERDRSDENTRQCYAMGGAPVTSGGQWYQGCDFPPSRPPCPCETPAEAPEGGRP